MEPSVMYVEVSARAAIIVTIAVIRISVPADAKTEALGACHRRCCNRYGRQCGENARNLLHSLLLSLWCIGKTVGTLRRSGNCHGTFLNRCSTRLHFGNQ